MINMKKQRAKRSVVTVVAGFLVLAMVVPIILSAVM